MARKTVDMAGKKYGTLTVVSQYPTLPGELSKWVCKCDCGNTCVIQARYLVSGRVTSCGCVKKTRKVGESTVGDYMNRPTSATFGILQLTDDPYSKLAQAIVAVAADDYRFALETDNKPLFVDVSSFFDSKWYRLLTDVDSAIITDRVDFELACQLQCV